MLTTPDNLLFFHLLDDGLQDKLLHHLSRDGGEADRPVVPWVLLDEVQIRKEAQKVLVTLVFAQQN